MRGVSSEVKLALGFLETYVRDAGIESIQEKDQVEQAAWEMGYDGTSLPTWIKTLGKHFKVDVVAEHKAGSEDRRGGGVGDFTPEEFFPEAMRREYTPEERANIEASDRAFRFLESQKPGQHLKVGRHDFTIWRSRGSEVFMTKGKGRKLYKLNVVNFTPLTVEVIEVSGGSGTPLGKPPIARFQP